MSAIVGIYNLDDRPVQRTDVELMVDVLEHRGPDGAAVWNDGSVGVGHRMLWTTPESLHEKLPLVDKTHDLTITSDARIDNRAELMELLGLASATHGELSDSQLILAAYVKWGEDCPQHLLGDFAFVIWDGRNHKLFCARDHFGVKPFYYHYRPGQVFACSSEIKALFKAVAMPRRINEKHIAEYLIYAFSDHQATFYQDVARLPAAHTLTVSQDKFEIKQYWNLRDTPMLPELSDQEYEQRFREILFEAVRCRMRSAYGPQSVGSFLSGGLDSSAIACVAREIRRKEASASGTAVEALPTLSIIFDEPDLRQCDEREYINAVLEGGDITPYWTLGEETSVLMDLEKVLAYTDEPIIAPNLCSSWVQYKATRNSGIHVILDGHGGDETIGLGHSRISELSQANRARDLWRELKALEKSGAIKGLSAREWMLNHLLQRYRVVRRSRRLFFAAKRLGSKKQPPRATSSSTAKRPAWKGLLNDEFASRIKAEALHRESWKANAREVQTDRTASESILTGALQPLALETLDKAAAAAGVEARYPLWDKRLVEFCIGLPSAQKLRAGVTRSIIRRALQGVLPEKIKRRVTKNDFSAQVLHGLRRHEIRRLNSLLESNWDASSAFLDKQLLQDILMRVLSPNGEEEDQEDVKNALSLVQATSLELWLREYTDEARSSDPSLNTQEQTALNS